MEYNQDLLTQLEALTSSLPLHNNQRTALCNYFFKQQKLPSEFELKILSHIYGNEFLTSPFSSKIGNIWSENSKINNEFLSYLSDMRDINHTLVPSIENIIYTASEYVIRSEKNYAPKRHITKKDIEASLTEFYDDRYAFTNISSAKITADINMCKENLEASKGSQGSSIIVFAPDNDEQMNKLITYARHLRRTKEISLSLPVLARLLPFMFLQLDGFYLSLTKSPEDYLGFDFSYLICAEFFSVPQILARAQDMGIRCERLGTLTDNGSYKIIYNSHCVCSLSRDCLKIDNMLCSYNAICADYPPESKNKTSIPVNNYLIDNAFLTSRLQNENYIFTYENIEYDFDASYRACIRALAKSAASGIDYREMKLSFNLILNKDKNITKCEYGKMLCGFLGIRRAICDFSLFVDSNLFCEYEKEPYALVFTSAMTKQIPIFPVFQRAGNNVFVLFEEISEKSAILFDKIHKLISDKTIISCALLSDGSFDLLEQNGYTCENKKYALQYVKNNIAFIVETSRPIKGVFIGKTIAIADQKETETK